MRSTAACTHATVLQAFFAAVFFSYIAVAYSWPKTFGPGDETAFLRVVAFALGKLSSLAIIGLMQSDSPQRNLYRAGLVGASMCLALTLLHSIAPFLWISLGHTFMICATNGFLAVAWCEHTAHVPPKQRATFLSLNSLFIILITTLLVGLKTSTAMPIIELLIIVTTLFQLRIDGKRKERQDTEENCRPTSLPRHLLVILFLYGAAQTTLCLCNRMLGSAFPRDVAASALPVWVVAICLGIFIMYLVSMRAKPVIVSVLVPFVSTALLAPYLFIDGGQSLQCVIVFVVTCDAAICGSGPSNARRSFTVGRFSFVFWYRSIRCIGALIGYAVGSFVLFFFELPRGPILGIALGVVYAVLCITVIALTMRLSNSEKPVPASCGNPTDASPSKSPAYISVAHRCGLTERETEVLELLEKGRSLPRIQEELHISHGTAATHVGHIYKKVGVSNRQELFDILEQEQLATKDV